jgi:hypothetical protein
MNNTLKARLQTALLTVAMGVGMLVSVQIAEARGYGFGGGSFRGGSYEGARGGQVNWGPRGGAVATGPEGAAAARTPYGGAAAVGPEGAAGVRSPYGGAAVRTPAGNVAVGYRVSAIPATAVTVVVAGQTYYEDNGVYYEQYFDGSEVVYVVVPVPQE